MKQILEARETQEEQFPWGQTSKQVDIQDQSLQCAIPIHQLLTF